MSDQAFIDFQTAMLQWPAQSAIGPPDDVYGADSFKTPFATFPFDDPPHMTSEIDDSPPSVSTPSDKPSPKNRSLLGRRHRASVACLTCRTRKIRCDAVIHGTPCTNCRLDSSQCVLAQDKRARRKLRKTVHEGSDGDGGEDEPLFMERNQNDLSNAYIVMPQSKDIAIHKEKVPSPQIDVVAHDRLPNTKRPTCRCADPANTPKEEPGSPRPRTLRTLPAFLQKLPSDLGLADVMLLDAQGICTLPDSGPWSALLEHFTRYIYWEVPVVGHRYVRMLMRPISERRVKCSLLLLNSMMFASATSAPMEVVRELGCQSRAEARTLFYKKATVLYNTGCERRPIAMIQALILLAQGSDDSDPWKGRTYWLGVVISLCYRFGLNRYPQPRDAAQLSDGAQRTWKRVWWSCYVLEHVTAIRAGRKPCIKHGDWDVARLSVEDFEPEGWPTSQDASCSRLSAESFLDKARLSVHTGRSFDQECVDTPDFGHLYRTVADPEAEEEDELMSYVYGRGNVGLDWQGGLDSCEDF